MPLGGMSHGELCHCQPLVVAPNGPEKTSVFIQTPLWPSGHVAKHSEIQQSGTEVNAVLFPGEWAGKPAG